MTPKICAVITDLDLAAISAAEPLVDLFEVRIDLIGDGWQNIARRLSKPWIATNRLSAEGGRWDKTEAQRKEELLKALEMGASIVDLELTAPNLPPMVAAIRKKARCLISYHDFDCTPPAEALKRIVERQLAAGADICKLVTSANSIDDNLRLLKLYGEFAGHKLVAFGMGEPGILSRVLAPLAGAEFNYAALETGRESAPGQITVAQLAGIYRLLKI